MSNTYQLLSPEDFVKAQRGHDGIQSTHRFLVHERPVEDMHRGYKITVFQYVNNALVAIERRLLIEPTCLVPIETLRHRKLAGGSG